MNKKNERGYFLELKKICENTGIDFEFFIKEKIRELYLRKLILSVPYPKWYRNNKGKLKNYLKKRSIELDGDLIEKIIAPYFGRDAIDDPTYRRAAKIRILQKSEYRCSYCKKPVDEVNVEIDHITPLALHGADDEINLKASCSDCNHGKLHRALEEFGIFWPTGVYELAQRGKNTLTRSERFSLLYIYDFLCSACRGSSLELKIAYRIPPRSGGQAVYDNLTVLCNKCISDSEAIECSLSLHQ